MGRPVHQGIGNYPCWSVGLERGLDAAHEVTFAGFSHVTLEHILTKIYSGDLVSA